MKPKVLLDRVGLWSATAVAGIAMMLGIAPMNAKAEFKIPTEVTDLGKDTYKKYCSPCHGEEGNGNGPLARSMLPKPRDFTRGAYKFRTTPSGSLPTDEDIYRTISFGVPNSTMIPWDILTEEQRLSVIPVLKSFSEAFEFRNLTHPSRLVCGLDLRKNALQRGKKFTKKNWNAGSVMASKDAEMVPALLNRKMILDFL